MCKPWKMNGAKTKLLKEKLSDAKRRLFAERDIKDFNK
jgi:hypothetical protein